jgi:hypothetical protein
MPGFDAGVGGRPGCEGVETPGCDVCAPGCDGEDEGPYALGCDGVGAPGFEGVDAPG